MKPQQYDSIIFDMDGTLWDAVDSYCEVWNTSFKQLGKDISINRHELLKCMGLPIAEIFSQLVNPSLIDATEFLPLLYANEHKMMPLLGGNLYDGVKNGIEMLSKRYKLFMVSNCAAEGIKNFMTYTSLTQYFTGSLTYGETSHGKAENIAELIRQNNLINPIYVGDTQGDCKAAHEANIPMVYAAYGFGKCDNPDYTVNSFTELTEKFLS